MCGMGVIKLQHLEFCFSNFQKDICEDLKVILDGNELAMASSSEVPNMIDLLRRSKVVQVLRY
jgi:hypothetical protein